jgi:SAM-dependent methyltransferase
MRDYSALDLLLNRLAGDVYPEAPSEPHLTITRDIIQALVQNETVRPGHMVLDVGCGQGLAAEAFEKAGAVWQGTVLGEDVNVCRQKGLRVEAVDQSFMPGGWSERFDLVWARHVLEHSPFPLLTLAEYHRVLKRGGHAYIEVPDPGTSARHETNPNHYSVFTPDAWLHLLTRSGFTILKRLTIPLNLPCGPDSYSGFLLKKE